MSAARDRAIVTLMGLLDRYCERQIPHTEVAEVVDALIKAARAPESDYSRAVAALQREPA